MRLLIPVFSTGGTWGGATRVVAMTGAAKRAGHEVAFCASGELAQTLRDHGYTVYDTPPSTMFGLPGPLSRIVERRSQNMSLPAKPGKSVGNLWFVFFVSGMARSGYLRQLVEAEMDAARSFKADMLFTDLDPGAFLMSAVTGLPIAMAYQDIMASVGIGSRSWNRMRRAITPVLHHYGRPAMNPEALWFAPSVLKIIPSIPELDGSDPNRPDVCYIGQLLGDIQPASDFQPEARRTVFVYVGLGSIPMSTLRQVLPQVFPAGGQLSCIVGSQSVRQIERIGPVEFRPYVPAETLLPCCDWTICHGGQNTIIQSLRHGVPLLVFPGAIFERRFNARKVQEAGAGLMAEVPDFNAAWLSAALRRQAEFAPRAAELGRRIRSYGGADAAIAAMEQHLEKSSPTHPSIIA